MCMSSLHSRFLTTKSFPAVTLLLPLLLSSILPSFSLSFLVLSYLTVCAHVCVSLYFS